MKNIINACSKLFSMKRNNAIGIFDSGFGGLSPVKEVFRQLPNEEMIYFADTARCPYGVRSLVKVRQFVFEIIEFLEKKDVKMVIIACNTATAAGLKAARARFSIPIIGVIEYGAKSAIKASKNNRIGVIATEGTIKSKAYQKAIKSLNSNVLVFSRGCQQFVELVEKGKNKGKEVTEIAIQCLSPLLKEDIDTLVLGCTHFPFLEDVIKKVIGERVTIVDPAIQTVQNMRNILQSKRLNRIKKEPSTHQFFTTGNIDTFRTIGERLHGKSIENLKHVDLHELIRAVKLDCFAG